MDLLSRLPQSFEFYDQGTVGLGPILENPATGASVTDLTDKFGIVILLQGDIKGVVIGLFDQGLDTSMYSEMMNVIASRLSDDLAQYDDLDVLITPPRVIEGDVLDRTLMQVLKGTTLTTQQSYLHLIPAQLGSSTVRFETLIYT